MMLRSRLPPALGLTSCSVGLLELGFVDKDCAAFQVDRTGPVPCRSPPKAPEPTLQQRDSEDSDFVSGPSSDLHHGAKAASAMILASL